MKSLPNPTPPGAATSASCARVQARLPALVDGALAPLEEARDRGHMEACPPCRLPCARHDDLLASIRCSLRAGTEEDFELVTGAVLARLADSGAGALRPVPPPAPGLRRWTIGLCAAAAAVLLLGLLASRA